VHLRQLLPPDLANWLTHDGVEEAAPFTVFCDGRQGAFWTEVPGATEGCLRCIGSVQDRQFVSFPMGILEKGLTLEARRALNCVALDPLQGSTVTNLTLAAGQRFSVPQGPGALVLRGTFLAEPGEPSPR
jgi:hypothetical protein